jgi:hypothetical protein
MATSVVSSPVRSTTGSPGFRSQRKLSVGTITRKIQTLQDTIESLRQQLVFTRTEEESVPQKEIKKPKQNKEKVPAVPKQKKIQESKQEEKDKIPMPWTGQADFATCVGLKSQYGLFIQCGKACDMSSASFQIDNHECRFCGDCSKKCDENGKHAVGTIEERIEAGVGKYVNAKTGKKETMYIEVLEKMNITKEEALESAARRGFQIPDWMLEKAEKKRGRPAASGATAASKVAGEAETETKEKKPKQPRAKATTAKATNKKTAAAKASVATNDTPQKTNSVQSSICVDLNDNDDDVTPVAASDSAVAASTPIPQEKEKKKRGRPTKSNAQNNVEESEMQRLIVQATTEKKKRLSLDPADIAPSSQEEVGQVETQLTFEENGSNKLDEDEIFDMFEKMLEEDEMNQQQQEKQQQEEVVAASVVEPVVIVATNEKKEKSKKTKKSDEKVEKVEKVEKKKDDKVAKKEAALAAKKKAEEEALAAAAKKRAEEEDDETEDEEDQEEEELECEEYEYDGETYGLAPNGDIYSQDGDLVGKLDNGVPKMF